MASTVGIGGAASGSGNGRRLAVGSPQSFSGVGGTALVSGAGVAAAGSGGSVYDTLGDPTCSGLDSAHPPISKVAATSTSAIRRRLTDIPSIEATTR